MKPGPAISTRSMASSSARWATIASAIFLGAMCASLALFIAKVELQSPFDVSCGLSKKSSVTSKAGRSWASWARNTAARTRLSSFSGILLQSIWFAIA